MQGELEQAEGAPKYTEVTEQELQAGDADVLEVLRDRYELIRAVGQGGQGKAFLGRDRQTGESVAVKEMQMNQVEEWKAIDLFEREARVLESISHPAIPAFIDSFHTPADGEQGMRFFLVQEFIEGEDLKDLMEGGLLIGESGVRAFLKEMLGILGYLHGRAEPVIHRDIKPSNIIRRNDRRLALIDFGAVQARSESHGISGDGRATIVGTSGYMPLEQMMGRSVPATDLYALAATTVHLLSRRHPSDLPVVDMEIRFGDFVNVSERLKKILKKMLAAQVEDRFASVEEVLRALDQVSGARTASTSAGLQFNQPGSGSAQFVMARRAASTPEPMEIQFGKSGENAPEFFSAWNEKNAQPQPIVAQDLAAPRPEVLLSEMVESDDHLHLELPRIKNSKRLWLLVGPLGFLGFGVWSGSFLWAEIASGPSGLNCGWLTFALVLFVAPTWIIWKVLSLEFERISVDIDAANLEYHRMRPLAVKTTTMALNMIDAIEFLAEPHGDDDMVWTGEGFVDGCSARIEVRSRYKKVLIGKGLPLAEQEYLAAQIRRRVFVGRS